MTNGKGDTYRPVNKKISDDTYDRVFGKKDEVDFQKCRKYKIEANPTIKTNPKG